MKKILVIGAGLSSSYLIKYLLANAKKENWQVTIADQSIDLAKQKIGKSKQGIALAFNINNQNEREEAIKNTDLVVSLLPPTLHIIAAHDCIKFKKNLVTASYVTPPMQSLNESALKANVLFLNEIGLDPGIDHLSAMEMIYKIQKDGGNITSFKSFCGGLVAPEFDTNPWNYKFTWNPRNVILAGQATAQYLENGLIKFIPPNRIFEQTETVNITNYGVFEMYVNRDSLSYIEPYGLQNATTVIRGTLRKKGFSQSWNLLVKLGLTDDSFCIHNSAILTYRDLVASFLSGANNSNVEEVFCTFFNITKASKDFKRVKWLGLFSNEIIGMENATPAQILQYLLQQKWLLEKIDLDMIVMKHEIIFELNNKKKKINSTLVVKGEDKTYTAMAKTVGLPMAIACKLILQNKIKAKGVQIPITAEFYEPILVELAKNGIQFIEE
ncbi:MAG: saccharopine dehydrogenase NADP-binding domain-containing protein [Bacteroidia bacterium]|nr:saccharopine dehydrogenase NADP-binding domain-containing protein [Bacteroidia bacterium]